MKNIAEHNAEVAIQTATEPGAFARHYEHKLGLARRFAAIDAYYVDAVAESCERVKVVELRGSGLHYVGPAAYALTEDGRLLPTLYLFPVARHQKPRVATLRDEMGSYQQWVAPLKPRCLRPWE